FIAKAGDRIRRTIRIPGIVEAALGIRIPQDDLSIRLDPLQHLGRREIVAFAVSDRNPQHLAGARGARERRVDLLDAPMPMLAAVLQASIAQHRARKQAGLEEDLKTVAD